MSQSQEPKLTFPESFLWGAATSSHQVEGATHNQWSVWELQNAKLAASKAGQTLSWLPDWQDLKPQATDPNNYISGRATDHFNRYESDFDLLTSFNMNAFRFSIEWSRVEPEEGKFDLEALAHYRRYLRALKARGIEPMMTLMHWTLPLWFHEKGAFEKRRNVKYFVRFAEKVLHELGSDVRYICTLNEPEVYTGEGWLNAQWPPNKQDRIVAFWVYLNLAHAHNRVAKMAHGMNRGFKLGLSKNCAHHYAGDDDWKSKLAARMAIWLEDYFFLNLTKRHLDWLGLNYYFSNRYFGFEIDNPNERVSDLGWNMAPEDIEWVLERLWRKYHVPLIVTESGVADRKDQYRKWWISHSLSGIYWALQKGVKVEGYLHWSLLDNFEWAYGKWPRFGLVDVDYQTFKRTPRPSALWFAKVIKKLRQP